MSDKITPLTKEDGQSKDLVKENVEKLKQLFPEIVTDGKVDFEILKEELGEFRETSDERYSFTWNGKSKARKLAMEPSRGTLRPAPEESVNWDDTDHLFLEGDNLEVLKLLQRGYHKKVKMIYIDPPYNTGKDFIYSDDYRDNLSNYLKITGQLDGEGKKISTNPDYSGRYHTDWLNMMYPRLKLARELLREDGVFVSSIDENEFSNLKKMLDEIFGEENFISSIAVVSNPRGRQSDTHIANVHDYLLVYAKSIDDCEVGGARLTEAQRSKFKYEDEKGKYRLLGLRQRGSASRRQDRPDMYFPIYVNKEDESVAFEVENEEDWEAVYPEKSDGTDGRWMWGKAKVKEDIDQLESKLIQTRDEYDIFVKDYLVRDGAERTRKFKTVWDNKYVNNQVGTVEVKNLLEKDLMSFPKSSKLILDICRLGCPKEGIVLDFFAGSCTTADSIMQYNQEDDFERKFIMVQLPEKTDKKSKAYKKGYKTVADLGKERIRQAIKKYNEENPDYDGDLGFKVFKLASSNIKPWDPSFEDVQLSIEDSIENVKPDRSEIDLLYEVLLKYGIDLSLPIEERTIDGSKVYIGGAGALVLCPSDTITLEVVEGIAEIKEEFNPEIMRVVFRDSGFKDDVVKTNAIQILKQHGIEDVKSI